MATHSLASRAAASSFAPTSTSTGSCPSFNCSYVSELQSNPDISGVGVLLGFAISNYLTLFFCAAYYYLNLDKASNPVDRLFLETFSPRSLGKASKKWSEALQSAVLTLGDSQVITGISVLISGYKQLACGLQYYHWTIVVDLAFFSSITHLTTLTCLRSYFQERPALRLWRLICMGVTAGLLAPALGSTGYILAPSGLPAQCLLTHSGDIPDVFASSGSPGGYDSLYMVIVMVFLSSSYLSRVVQLFPSAPPVMRKFFRTRPSNILQGRMVSLRDRARSSPTKSSTLLWSMGYRLLSSIYCILKAAADLYGSLLWEITWLALASVWGTISVLVDRESSSLSDDNTWGFGQVVPLVLLILPFVAFFEVVYEIFFPPDDKGLSSAHLSNALNVPHQSSTTISLRGQTEPYHDVYEHGWFRKLILLMYGLTLGLAGNLLWAFPYAGLSKDLQPQFLGIVHQYGSWLGYNLGIVWIFTIMSLYSLYKEPTLESTRTISQFIRLRRRILPLVHWPWTLPVTGYILIIMLLLSSACVARMVIR